MKKAMAAAIFSLIPLWGANLTLSVSGVKVERGGDLLVLVWKPNAGFPKADKAFRSQILAPAEAVDIVLSNMDPGEYAAAVIHDANRNGRMDFRFPFIPVEGSMFTGGKRPWGPPSWGNHHFTLGPEGGRQPVALIY